MLFQPSALYGTKNSIKSFTSDPFFLRNGNSHVVGYQDKEVTGNSYFNFVVPTFEKVDGTTLKLADLSLKYVNPDQSSQNIWTLDLGGATKQTYYYVNEAVAEDWGEDPADVVGWYKDSNCTEPAGDVELPYGQGFALVSVADTTKVVFSGAVYPGEVAVDIKGGNIFNFTGNCLPVGCKLNDLALIYEVADQSSQNIWTLDIGGATQKAYYYVNEAVAEDWGEDPADVVGWYKDSNCTEPAGDVDLPAGQGVAIVSVRPIQLLVPAAISTAK